jgi:hypothetical protein
MPYPNERMVRLHDGREVSNYGEEWRHECEAVAVLAMPTKRERQDYLYGTWNATYKKDMGGVLGKRGADEVKRLETTILAIWALRKQSAA